MGSGELWRGTAGLPKATRPRPPGSTAAPRAPPRCDRGAPQNTFHTLTLAPQKVGRADEEKSALHVPPHRVAGPPLGFPGFKVPGVGPARDGEAGREGGRKREGRGAGRGRGPCPPPAEKAGLGRWGRQGRRGRRQPSLGFHSTLLGSHISGRVEGGRAVSGLRGADGVVGPRSERGQRRAFPHAPVLDRVGGTPRTDRPHRQRERKFRLRPAGFEVGGRGHQRGRRGERDEKRAAASFFWGEGGVIQGGHFLMLLYFDAPPHHLPPTEFPLNYLSVCLMRCCTQPCKKKSVEGRLRWRMPVKKLGGMLRTGLEPVTLA